MMRRKQLTAICFVALLVLIGCDQTEVRSTWAVETVTVDGDDSEWAGRQIPVADERAALGIMNDAEYLYISFRTANRSGIRRLLTGGFTVWIDPQGGTRKQLGIRYPLGADMLGVQMMDPPWRAASTDEAWFQSILDAQLGIEILGPKRDDVFLLPVSNDAGVAVGVGLSRGQLTYELRLPLKGDAIQNGFHLSADPREAIGVGFETGPLDQSLVRGRPGLAMGEPGLPGGGGMGGPMGSMPDGGTGGGSFSDPLAVWTRVILAGPG